MILTKMHSPLGRLGPSTSVTTYRLLLASVYHLETAPLLAIRCVMCATVKVAAPVAAVTLATRGYLVSRFAVDRGFAGTGWEIAEGCEPSRTLGLSRVRRPGGATPRNRTDDRTA